MTSQRDETTLRACCTNSTTTNLTSSTDKRQKGTQCSQRLALRSTPAKRSDLPSVICLKELSPGWKQYYTLPSWCPGGEKRSAGTQLVGLRRTYVERVAYPQAARAFYHSWAHVQQFDWTSICPRRQTLAPNLKAHSKHDVGNDQHHKMRSLSE